MLQTAISVAMPATLMSRSARGERVPRMIINFGGDCLRASSAWERKKRSVMTGNGIGNFPGLLGPYGQDHHIGPPVFGAARLCAVRRNRLVRAIALRDEPVSVQLVALHQVIDGGLRALQA